MSKKKPSSETGNNKDVVVADTGEPADSSAESGSRDAADPAPEAAGGAPGGAATNNADAPAAGNEGSDDAAAGLDAAAASTPEDEPRRDDDGAAPPAVPGKAPRPRRSWFGLFNFLLIIAMAGAAGYYWWLEQQLLQDYRATIADLESRLETKAAGSRLDSALAALRAEIGGVESKLGGLESEQQGLRESSEKLYQLFGRDRADWQLAEVEYLMRVAQHKLILEQDFAGAAVTLQAASDRIGQTGDPGLLPVRVTISEEIAELKTRERPDLVGMTLVLAQLARQARTLQPGFAPRVDASGEVTQGPPPAGWRERVAAFIDSLVEVRHESKAPTEIEASVANVGETLEDDLKLARWAVLDRDARQYAELIDRSLRLLREYYDLDNAANHDFMTQLQTLQKMQLEPDKPDITGSLRQLQRILSQRENAPADGEPVDG